MKITYLGHAAIIIEEGSFKCIVDPYLTGNPLCPVNVDDVTGLTHVFVTHGHGDHIGDTVELARANDALVIANAEISDYLAGKGLRTHGMHIGGRKKFDFGTVKLTPALHGSGIDDGGVKLCGGNPCGFLIEVGGKKVYHAGDTGLTMDMKLLDAEGIDIAFMPIGGNYTMDIDDAVRAVEFVKPKKAVPMHYNTFGLIEADPQDFKDKVKNCEVIIMGINETVEI